MNPKPATYSVKRKRKPGEMNVDRRQRWVKRIWISLFGKPKTEESK